MRYGGFCGLSKKHLSTERDINLVHKLHLQKEKKRKKKRLKRLRKFVKQLGWACFSPIIITIIMVIIIINLPGLVDFVKKMILKPQPKFWVCWEIKRFFFCLRTTNKSELCSGKKEEIVQVLRCLMKNLSSDWLMGHHDNKKRKKEKRKVKRRWVTEARRVWFGWASLWFRLGQNEKFWGNVWI